MLKRLLALFVACIILTPQVAVAAGRLPDIAAKSAIVIEATTGKVLYSKNADERRYPASTTKMMTLIVALEQGNLNDMVTASPNAANTEGSSLWLQPGEKLKMLDMLYGMMLISGNDATVAIAEHIAGSVDNFARRMTEKAHAIGALNTNFTNSSGLPDTSHYSTAADLAKIAAYGYKNPLFAKIVSTQHTIIPWPGKDHDRDLYNENKLLWLYDGANGVKTGYTDAAGRCLVSGAKRGGIQMVAVVLDSDRMWDDSMRLLDLANSQLQPVRLLSQGDILKTVRVDDSKTDTVRLVATSDVTVAVSDDDKDQFSTVVVAPNRVDAPVTAGKKLGVVKTYYKNQEIGSVDLVAADSAERKSFFGLIWGSLWSFFTYIVKNFA
ncbi:MAG: D-alanyl-D-alanine carboxypeptidase [Negativicutes bacterium]|nr:D-alanyl-D-alanine carboxypeptidase [Negativicutes bacterium]